MPRSRSEPMWSSTTGTPAMMAKVGAKVGAKVVAMRPQPSPRLTQMGDEKAGGAEREGGAVSSLPPGWRARKAAASLCCGGLH